MSGAQVDRAHTLSGATIEAGAAPPSDDLRREQLRLALANLAPNAYTMPVFALVICILFAQWVPVPTLVGWGLTVTIVGLPLGIVSRKVRALKTNEGKTSNWVALATLSHVVFAMSWSSMALFLWVPGSDLNHMLLQLILAATLAGNMALSGPSRPLTINGYAVHGLAFIFVPLRTGGMVNDLLSVLALIFVGYMILMSMEIYRTAKRMLTLASEKNHLLEEKNRLIAELSQSKLESERARIESDRANQAKSRFLANMSHELRTPLNAVIGFSELLKSRPGAGKTTEYADIIGQSGAHLLGLINDILDLSKVEAGRLELHEEEVDLGRSIRECVDSLRAKIDTGRLTVEVGALAQPLMVRADDRCIRQILLNLLSNALRYTKPGGLVHVSTRLSADDIQILVRDTGVGIAGDDLARVFESFEQGSHRVVSGHHGTGLGLPIVKGLAEAHGGRVTLESAVGKGTCVTVHLPASRLVFVDDLSPSCLAAG